MTNRGRPKISKFGTKAISITMTIKDVYYTDSQVGVSLQYGSRSGFVRYLIHEHRKNLNQDKIQKNKSINQNSSQELQTFRRPFGKLELEILDPSFPIEEDIFSQRPYGYYLD